MTFREGKKGGRKHKIRVKVLTKCLTQSNLSHHRSHHSARVGTVATKIIGRCALPKPVGKCLGIEAHGSQDDDLLRPLYISNIYVPLASVGFLQAARYGSASP